MADFAPGLCCFARFAYSDAIVLLGPIRVTYPNGISIDSAVFCGAHERDQHADTQAQRPRCSVCSNRPHLAIAAMRTKIGYVVNFMFESLNSNAFWYWLTVCIDRLEFDGGRSPIWKTVQPMSQQRLEICTRNSADVRKTSNKVILPAKSETEQAAISNFENTTTSVTTHFKSASSSSKADTLNILM